jgi:hypothetical protein
MVSNDFTQKNPNQFTCKSCDFFTFNKKDFNRHIKTKKHTSNVSQWFSTEKTQKTPYQCSCGRLYKDNSGLWRHKKRCNKIYTDITDINEEPSEFKITTKMFYDLLKQNNELQKSIIEISKEKPPIINNNCNNKTFNLQVYLNETCKNAINLTDFVDSIKVQIKDLERVGEKGYAEGISDIFISNLQQLNTHSRPIHCSDSKREILYIKDAEQWTKDDECKTVLTKAIKQVANKNIKQISEWQKLHPEYSDPESKQNDKYMKIVLNSMSGSTKEESTKNYEKIVKNVIKETIIEK